MKSKVQINELRIRTTGLNRGEAQRLGEKVAKRLSKMTSNLNRSRRIPELAIRINAETSEVDRIAQAISERIRRGLS